MVEDEWLEKVGEEKEKGSSPNVESGPRKPQIVAPPRAFLQPVLGHVQAI